MLKIHFGLAIRGFDIDEIDIVGGIEQFIYFIECFALLEIYTMNDGSFKFS